MAGLPSSHGQLGGVRQQIMSDLKQSSWLVIVASLFSTSPQFFSILSALRLGGLGKVRWGGGTVGVASNRLDRRARPAADPAISADCQVPLQSSPSHLVSPSRAAATRLPVRHTDWTGASPNALVLRSSGAIFYSSLFLPLFLLFSISPFPAGAVAASIRATLTSQPFLLSHLCALLRKRAGCPCP